MSQGPKKSGETPSVGILMLETSFPRIPGDIGNPATFDFPVAYRTVEGASPRNVVIRAEASLIEDFIAAGRELVARGARVLTTSCGFLSLFHRRLTEALPVPVFTSSLLQVHLAAAVIRADREVGVITARKESLTAAHFTGVGVQRPPKAIVGMEKAGEFHSVFIEGKNTLDEARCEDEMREATSRLLEMHPNIGAIVLECTNMPPYADAVREVSGLPVFDAVTLVNYAHSVATPGGLYSQRA